MFTTPLSLPSPSPASKRKRSDRDPRRFVHSTPSPPASNLSASPVSPEPSAMAESLTVLLTLSSSTHLPVTTPITPTPAAVHPPTPPMTINTPPPLPVDSNLHWGFLTTAALLQLPRWPGSLTPQIRRRSSWRDRSMTPESFHSLSPSPAMLDVTPPTTPRPEVPSSLKPFPLLQLLSIPPIASSIASALYGHDLRTLRALNREFYEFLYPRRTLPPAFLPDEADSAEDDEVGFHSEPGESWPESLMNVEKYSTLKIQKIAGKRIRKKEDIADGRRSYYHVLLRKTMLCPRTACEGQTEPRGRNCTSAGGNTCVSPEIWTTNRYRYLCPRCISPRRHQLKFNAPLTPASTPLRNPLTVPTQIAFSYDSRPPSTPSTPYNPLTHRPTGPRRGYCTCQVNPWVCRTCYTDRWVKDLLYSRVEWSKACKCLDCGEIWDHSKDPRVPKGAEGADDRERRKGLFLSWVMEGVRKSRIASPIPSSSASSATSSGSEAAKEDGRSDEKKPGVDKRRRGGKGGKVKIKVKERDRVVERERERAGIRPVGCSWCLKRIDAECEEWTAVPDTIRRGQEKGWARKGGYPRLKAEPRV
ncbi:hypothetical protein RUND412_009515 [Rhizina undulata]